MARRPNATQLSPCAVAAGGKRGHRGHGQGHPSGFASGLRAKVRPPNTGSYGISVFLQSWVPRAGVRAIFILLWQCRVGQVRTRGMETITGPCLVSRSDLGKYLNLQTTADTNRRPNAWKCLRKPPLLAVCTGLHMHVHVTAHRNTGTRGSFSLIPSGVVISFLGEMASKPARAILALGSCYWGTPTTHRCARWYLESAPHLDGHTGIQYKGIIAVLWGAEDSRGQPQATESHDASPA